MVENQFGLSKTTLNQSMDFVELVGGSVSAQAAPSGGGSTQVDFSEQIEVIHRFSKYNDYPATGSRRWRR